MRKVVSREKYFEFVDRLDKRHIHYERAYPIDMETSSDKVITVRIRCLSSCRELGGWDRYIDDSYIYFLNEC